MIHRLKKTIGCFAVLLSGSLCCQQSKAVPLLPPNLPGEWSVMGRTEIRATTNSVVIQGGFIKEKQTWADAEIDFRAQAPANVEQTQIWAAFRCRDRDSRYVFALRGGNNNDLYLARYAPDGGAKFLGFAPLDFKPVPGEWYRFKVVTLGNRFQIFLNDEKLPRLNVTDGDALWEKGSVCLGGGWLPAEFADLQVKPLTETDKAVFLSLGDRQWSAPALDKEALRKKQRAEYQPASVAKWNPLRTEVSLDGNWLFLPDYQLPDGQQPVQLDYDDANWHVLPVPSFWTPGLSWLHGEIGFSNLMGTASTKGVAESLFVRETARCAAYTFDWRKTDAAWYRHYLELPSDLGDRHFELDFDAIAKISEVWVNGSKVGAHTGMFGEVKCDVTKALRPGKNVIAVHVASKPKSGADSNSVEGVAVTVEVTSSMLYSLPHGMFQNDVGGIWQPVKLTASAPVFTSDYFIKPGLHGAEIHLSVSNAGQQSQPTSVGYAIISAQDGTILYSNETAQTFLVPAGDVARLNLTTPHLNPKLWSPAHPNLYRFEFWLKQEGKIVDSCQVQSGFRTFAVDGSKFLLNGQPFRLLGANPFPNTLRPNDEKLARRFLEIAREGNVQVTRSHIVPYTSTWLDAADQTGMAVSFEGTWPWLMLRGEAPDNDLITAWREEFISLIHKHRNHPSIILWTVNNEMKFEELEQNNPESLKKKWSVLNEAIKAMRQADPTRPVVADSSYIRHRAQRGYQTVVRPQGFDDGDVDDRHSYNGWYNPTFFNLNNGEFAGDADSSRPLISQELSTGYPNNDDGHPTRFYLFKHHTPQALVGDDAYENADPAIFLKRQAFMTKELTETLRRTAREKFAGALLFSYLTWFQTPWDASQIKPWPAYDSLKAALQPVLVSAELYGRHFYAGDTIRRRVCIINDDENYNALPASQLVWEFQAQGQILAQGQIEVPLIDYYQNHWLDADFAVPKNLPTPRVDGQLVLRLKTADGKVLSENRYDVVLTTIEWARNGNKPDDEHNRVLFWNPGRHSEAGMFDIPMTTINSLAAANITNLLIVGDLQGVTLTEAEAGQLKQFISQGGRAFLLHPRNALTNLFPESVKAYVAKQGEIVTMRIPESPVFSGIEPLDLAWFERGERKLPIACSGVYQIAAPRDDAIALAQQCDIHGYLNEPSQVAAISGTPLLELRFGQGRLVAGEMDFAAGNHDPIARRLLNNVVNYLRSGN